MSKLEDIEKAIAQLSPQELGELRTWFEDFDGQVFDEKIERDAKSGRLGKLAAQARSDHEAGRSRKL